MSPSAHTEVTRRGYFSRIKDSIKGIFFGIILFIIAFPLLFWNEGRAVRTAKGLREGLGAVVSITAERVDSANEGNLVHLSGEARTNDILTDRQFQFISMNAIKLSREVEMFQWREVTTTRTEKKVGGAEETTTEYNYEKVWSSNHINSSNFRVQEGHQNPPSMMYEAESWTANDVSLGAFKLSPSLINRISNYKDYHIQDDEEGTISARLLENMQISGGNLYYGREPANPQIGDMRISFRYIEPVQTVSIISRQVGSTFEPYTTSVGTTIQMLNMGVHSADGMFEAAFRANKTMTWIWRFVGFFMMFIGISMVLKPLSVLGDVIPFVGSIIGMGTSIFAGIIALIFSFLTIAIGWIFYRPLLGIFLLLIVIGLVVLTVILLLTAKKKKVVEVEETEAEA